MEIKKKLSAWKTILPYLPLGLTWGFFTVALLYNFVIKNGNYPPVNWLSLPTAVVIFILFKYYHSEGTQTHKVVKGTLWCLPLIINNIYWGYQLVINYGFAWGAVGFATLDPIIRMILSFFAIYILMLFSLVISFMVKYVKNKKG